MVRFAFRARLCWKAGRLKKPASMTVPAVPDHELVAVTEEVVATVATAEAVVTVVIAVAVVIDAVVATAVVATISAIDAKLFANNQTALSNQGGFFHLKRLFACIFVNFSPWN